MPSYQCGALVSGGKYETFSDGSGGLIRLEWRVDLQTPALELWGGRPDESSADNVEHEGLSQLAVLSP